jgi:hypothetical protein
MVLLAVRVAWAVRPKAVVNLSMGFSARIASRLAVNAIRSSLDGADLFPTGTVVAGGTYYLSRLRIVIEPTSPAEAPTTTATAAARVAERVARPEAGSARILVERVVEAAGKREAEQDEQTQEAGVPQCVSHDFLLLARHRCRQVRENLSATWRGHC